MVRASAPMVKVVLLLLVCWSRFLIIGIRARIHLPNLGHGNGYNLFMLYLGMCLI